MRICFLLFMFILNKQDCTAQKLIGPPTLSAMVKDSLILDFVYDCPENLKIKRENNKVEFMLFEEFDDTLSLYINNKHYGNWILFTKNNPFTSTGFSGFSFNLVLKRKKNDIIFELVGKKRYIEFELDKKYPLYTVQRYNGIWYVNGRICKPNFK